MSLEVQVWREVTRAIEIGELVTRLTPMLSRHLPLDLVLVRRLELAATRLETVAMGEARPGQGPRRARTECTFDTLSRVLEWCRAGVPTRAASRDDDPVLAQVVPPGIQGEVMAAPLVGDDGPAGVIILVASPHQRFTARHAAVLESLLEPLSMALQLDKHFHELARLREAAEADNRALLSRLGREEIVETIVGADAGLREVMSRVEQVSPTDVPVLILGETGSGKEVVARAIHARSRRASGPVLRVNCGAIPSEIIDSELFGHERGSFTGAVALRKGWFERADGGTLFLDEIGELPLAAQVRLLRILQDGSFERVGGQKPLTVDVRIVAATHRDLPAMVAAGTFRADLWYRIGVFVIRLPPLREHLEDMPALARYFASRAGRRLTGVPLEPTLEDLRHLASHNWPGNVRELSAVIERAAILGNCQRLDIPAAMATITPMGIPQPGQISSQGGGMHPPFEGRIGLTPTAWGSAPVMQEAWPVGPHLSSYPGPGAQELGAVPRSQFGLATLDATMAQHITQALTMTRGRIEGRYGAAAMLGINPHTLRARMRKLKIDWKRYRFAPGEDDQSDTQNV